MEAYDGTEICELVGIFTLSLFSKKYYSNDIVYMVMTDYQFLKTLVDNKQKNMKKQFNQSMNTSKSKKTLTHWLIERKFLGSKSRYTIHKRWKLVNDKGNNYSKRLLNCIRLCKIRFSLMLELGHYRAEKPPFWKKYSTSYSIFKFYKFK